MEDQKVGFTVTINKQAAIQILLIFELALLLFFGWQLWHIKQAIDHGSLTANTTQGTNAAGAAAAPTAQAATGSVPAPRDSDHLRGTADAPVTLIEYSDFECPYCKDFHSTLQQVLDTYGDQVNLVYRHYPLSFHQNAEKEAEASECVAEQGGDKAFWQYADTVFERTTSNGTGFPIANLVPLAGELGLNTSKFKDCLDSGKYANLVSSDETEGSAAGVTGTPGTFIYNNKTGKSSLIPGALPFSQVKPMIDAVLNG